MTLYDILDVLSDKRNPMGLTKEEAEKECELRGGNVNCYMVVESEKEAITDLFSGLQ